MANEKRLIDANAVLKWLQEITDPKEWLVSQYNADWIWSMIDSHPTVEAVEVKHGEWTVECKNRLKCSNCGFGRNTDTQLGWNYCPNCGAKMN